MDEAVRCARLHRLGLWLSKGRKTAPRTQGGGLCTLCHLLASAAPTLALPSLNVPAVPSPRRLPPSDAALFRLRRVCPRPPRSAWSILQVLQCQLPSGSVTLIVQRVCPMPVSGPNPSHGLCRVGLSHQDRCIGSPRRMNSLHFMLLQLLFRTRRMWMYSVS